MGEGGRDTFLCTLITGELLVTSYILKLLFNKDVVFIPY